ncbi:hypothetical protein N0V90_002850 [Kalmusia sp. IMI 367209]|nr:hypothetical protein N0V90_002850 [Kalmusia sp. IMI 367209]
MVTEKDDVQPAQDQCREVDQSWSEEELPEQQEQLPTEKSGVYVNKRAPNAAGRFNKRDAVHMSLIENGARTKGSFTISKGRLHPSGYWEYQLADSNGTLYKNGAWIREKELRIERRG